MVEQRGPGTVRAFVAIELDVELRRALGALCARLCRAPQGRLGRWVSPEGIHLTLQFLGDVPRARIPELEQALQRAVAGVRPFEVTLSGLGCFPNAQRPRVLWVGIEEATGALQSLQRAVERELQGIGFRPEGRPFTPHLTLARVRDHVRNAERAELGSWVRAEAVGALGSMHVHEVCLMQSDLRPGGAVYTRLCAAILEQREE